MTIIVDWDARQQIKSSKNEFCQFLHSDCGPLSAPTFGTVITPWGTSYGKQAIYSCNVEGYQVVGTSVRVCQEDLNWSGEKPVCNIAGKLVNQS